MAREAVLNSDDSRLGKMGDAPDYKALLKLLPVLRNWIDATGEVMLTAEEAARIWALGFTTAQSGRWKIPAVPYEFVVGTCFEYLANGWSAPLGDGQRPLPQPARVKTSGLPPTSRVELETPLLDLPFTTPSVVAPPRLEPAVQDRPGPEPPAQEKASGTEEAREAEEARKAEVELVAGKILKAVHKAGGRLAKRRAQQRLSRHTGIFRDALRELIARGLVVVEGPLVLAVAGVMQAASKAALEDRENRVPTII